MYKGNILDIGQKRLLGLCIWFPLYMHYVKYKGLGIWPNYLVQIRFQT